MGYAGFVGNRPKLPLVSQNRAPLRGSTTAARRRGDAGSPSELQPQGHGDGTVAALRRDLSERGRGDTGAGCTQVRVVEEVVQLRAELQTHAFADGLPAAHD